MSRSKAAAGRHRGTPSASRTMRRGRAIALAAAVTVSMTALVGGVLPDADPDVADAASSVAGPATNVRSEPTTATAGPTPEPTETTSPTPAAPKKPLRVPEAGSGTFIRASVAEETPDAVLTYSVEVEDNLPIKLSGFAGVVRRTLADPRGWTQGDPTALVMTNGEADLRIVLTTPETTDRLCAPLQTRGRVSCRNGRNVVLNAYRWVNGAESYGSDLGGYRRYLINHEVGHALGNGHETCPEPGALSPVMLQQTLGLQGCRANSWPARVDLLD